MMATRHGHLAFPHLCTIPPRVVRDALDAGTLALITPPGFRPEDLPELGGGTSRASDCLAIVEDGRFAGAMIFDTHRTAMDTVTSVGFWLRTSARRRGILTSAWRTLSRTRGPRFAAACWPDNEASCAALKSLGFVELGLWRHPCGDYMAYEAVLADGGVTD
jgi:hypothetical protein